MFSKHPSFGFFTYSGLIIAHHCMTQATAPGLMRLRRHRLSCFTVRVFPRSRARLIWLNASGSDTVAGTTGSQGKNHTFPVTGSHDKLIHTSRSQGARGTFLQCEANPRAPMRAHTLQATPCGMCTLYKSQHPAHPSDPQEALQRRVSGSHLHHLRNSGGSRCGQFCTSWRRVPKQVHSR